MKIKRTPNLKFLDLGLIKSPPKLDYGNDLVGQIADFMHDHKKASTFPQSGQAFIRRFNQKVREPRKNTQQAWANLEAALMKDRDLIGILDKKDLIEPLQEIDAIIKQKYEYTSDTVGRRCEPHTLLALWAADEFFPNWEAKKKSDRPIERTDLARTLNEALQRIGFNDGDKTESIRILLYEEAKIINSC